LLVAGGERSVDLLALDGAIGTVELLPARFEAARDGWRGTRHGVSRLRAIAIAVIRRPRDGALLVLDGNDPATCERFFRPLGGGIEFGELAAQTVVRELREEIGAEIVDVMQIGFLENLFTLDGKPHHELVVVFSARLVDEALFERESIAIDENGEQARALWVRLEDCRAEARPEAPPMYPDGLSALLGKTPET
jgi:8-oxo-dGTP pyrophosphatase MutT (NUDIX family)